MAIRAPDGANKHGGRDTAKQMIKIAESYLSNLEDQLQALNNDPVFWTECGEALL